jgi:hypothetical protein
MIGTVKRPAKVWRKIGKKSRQVDTLKEGERVSFVTEISL